MPQYQVKQKIVFPATLNDIRTILKVPLNNEWYILFRLARCNKVCAQPMNISVEIHRQNTDGKHLIFGVLKIMNDKNLRMWEKKYSQMIKTGAGFIKVDAFAIHIFGCFTYWLQGIVNISDNCENFVNALENGRSKGSNHLKSLEELSSNLERLLDPKSTCFSDVTIKCGSESIPAHKIILSARFPVFAAMFSNPMKESHKNEVDISDMDVSVLRALLTYMYTGKTNDLSASLAEGLLFAADKYQLEDLKSVCCDILKDSVSLQNVLRILVLGELHAEDLKSFVVDYICKMSAEFSALEKSEEWKILRKDRPELAIDVLSTMVNFKNKN